MWYQLSLSHCDREHADMVTEALENAGALSITYLDKNDEPMLEPEIGTAPVWRENVIQALFDTLNQANNALNQLAQQYEWITGSIEEIVDQDWQRASMDLFQPQQFGEKLWICPSWITPPDPHAINIILDPGLAFGTGTHPTTSLCLEWLANANLSGLKVIDYGCGSGILAIAALKLGAQLVQAVDLDEQALQATESNAQINHIESTQLKLGFPSDLQSQSDLILANILLGPLLSLQSSFHKLLKAGGTLVLSGILNEQADELIIQYSDSFHLKQIQSREDWTLLELRKI